MEEVLGRFLARPDEYAAEIELLRFWSFSSLDHFLPLWIFSPKAKLNLKPSRSSRHLNFKILEPTVLSSAVKNLVDLGLCVKFSASTGDRIRLWDDVTPQDKSTLKAKLFDSNFAAQDQFLLDQLLLIETLAPQTHFYDIFSVQKREMAAHAQCLANASLQRIESEDCLDALKHHVLESEDFGVFLAAVVVLSSVESSWTKIPPDVVANMEFKLKHGRDMVDRANEKGLFDSRRLTFHLDVAEAWKSRIVGVIEDAVKFGERAAASALEWNAADAKDGNAFPVIDVIEYAHADLLCTCLEKDVEKASLRTKTLMARVENAADPVHPPEYLSRVKLELLYEAAVLRRNGADASPETLVEVIKMFEEFNAGYKALEGPNGYHLGLGLMEIIATKYAQTPDGAHTDCVPLINQCLQILETEIGPVGVRQTELRFMLAKPGGWNAPGPEVNASIYLHGIDRAKKFYGKNSKGVWEMYRHASTTLSGAQISTEIKNSIAQESITVAAKTFGKTSKEYAEALLFHAQTANQSHASFLPHIRTSLSLLETFKLETLADRELIANAQRLLVRFYRSRNDNDKAFETVERGLETLGPKLDWPSLGLRFEKMDILLAQENAQLALDESRKALAETQVFSAENDPEEIRSADTLIWLRSMRAAYKISSTDGYKTEFLAAFDIFCERFSSCPQSRTLIIEAYTAALIDAAAVNLHELTSEYYDKFVAHIKTVVDKEPQEMANLQRMQSFEHRFKAPLKEEAAEAHPADEEDDNAFKPSLKKRAKRSRGSVDTTRILLLSLVAATIGISAAWVAIRFSSKKSS